jgi:hypothetical protein
VAIRYEMIHDARVIPLDGRPQLSSTIRQYFGDSRGRWDGDTLVVEVTNFPTNMINYRGAGGGLRLVERFRRVDATTVRYEVTVSDPETFAKPWTAALSLKSGRMPDVFEYASTKATTRCATFSAAPGPQRRLETNRGSIDDWLIFDC